MKYSWHSKKGMYNKTIFLTQVDQISIGLTGGHKAQAKNEDGLFVHSNTSNIAVILDAHTSDDSVHMIVEALEKMDFDALETLEINKAIRTLDDQILQMLEQLDTESLEGETAFLLVYEREGYLHWLSIGDNSLYLFHKEFNALSQYRLNTRLFYQWVGKANSLKLSTPCYVQGTIELRHGINDIVMLTDGVLEIEDRPFENDGHLKDKFQNFGIKGILEVVLEKRGIDNATIIAWQVDNDREGLRPTRKDTK